MRRRAVLALLAAGLVPGRALARSDPAAGPSANPGGRLVFTQVETRGARGVFLVDTGAPATVLDARFARAARARLGGGQTVQGGGRATRARIAEHLIIRPQAGGPRSLMMLVTDLSPIAALLGHRLDGILGGDYFAGRVARLDFRSGEAAFPEGETPPPGAQPVEIRQTPYVRAAVTVGGARVEGPFQIDTGANLAAVLWAPFASRAFPKVRGEPGQSMGIAGASASRLATLDALEFAGLRLQGVTADIGDAQRPDDAGADHAGALGAAAFAGRVLTLDYGRQRMWVD